MRIIETDTYKGLEQNQNSKDFVSSITNVIFTICKEDNQFKSVKENITYVDESINVLKKKLDKSNRLISKSQAIKLDVEKKIHILDNENLRTKHELLEALGSSLWI